MAPRPIVRDPDSFPNRWQVAGTYIFIEDIQRDYQQRGDSIRAGYRTLGLSDEELDAAISFPFPSISEAEIVVQFVSLIVHCECGIRRQAHATGPALLTDPCPCGRVWRIPVGIQRPNGHDPLATGDDK